MRIWVKPTRIKMNKVVNGEMKYGGVEIEWERHHLKTNMANMNVFIDDKHEHKLDLYETIVM
jgi:hypothetical protein